MFYIGQKFFIQFFTNIKFSLTLTKYFNFVFTLNFCPGHACFRTGLVFTPSLKKKNTAGSKKKFVKTAQFGCNSMERNHYEMSKHPTTHLTLPWNFSTGARHLLSQGKQDGCTLKSAIQSCIDFCRQYSYI